MSIIHPLPLLSKIVKTDRVVCIIFMWSFENKLCEQEALHVESNNLVDSLLTDGIQMTSPV